MNPRLFVLLLALLLICSAGMVHATPTGQRPPKPQYDVEKILSADNIATDVRQRLLDNAGLGLNRVLWSSGQWEEKAELDETPFRNVEKDESLPPILIRQYGTQAVVSREIAIDKLREENKDGKNDRKISEGYLHLAETYSVISRTSPDYATWERDMLEEATNADKSNINAWNQRIAALEQAGMYQEAADVKHQRDLAVESEGGSGLMDFLLPLSPLVTLAGVLLAVIGIGISARRQRRDS